MGEAKRRKLAGTYPVQTPKPPKEKREPLLPSPEAALAMISALSIKRGAVKQEKQP